MICSIEAALCTWDQALNDINWHIYIDFSDTDQLEMWPGMCSSLKPLLFHVSFLLFQVTPEHQATCGLSGSNAVLIFGANGFWEGVKQPPRCLYACLCVAVVLSNVSWWDWFNSGFAGWSYSSLWRVRHPDLCSSSAPRLMLLVLLPQNLWRFHLNSLPVSKAQLFCHQKQSCLSQWDKPLTRASSGGITV